MTDLFGKLIAMGKSNKSIHRPQAKSTTELLSCLAESPDTYAYFMALNDSEINPERAFKEEEAHLNKLVEYGLVNDDHDDYTLTEFGKEVHHACSALTNVATTTQDWSPLFTVLPSWNETVISPSFLEVADCVSGSAFTGNQGAERFLRGVREDSDAVLIDPLPPHRAVLAEEEVRAEVLLTESSVSESTVDDWSPSASQPIWYRWTQPEDIADNVLYTVEKRTTSVAVTESQFMIYAHDTTEPHQSVLAVASAQDVSNLAHEFRSLKSACSRCSE
ncbi:hypothetical protein [Haloarcula brevis]|uniref:hypothetical protein n=1 Tax=Haloarcula brevis TaxID=3111453 RepID=UPI00300E832A